MQAFLDNLGINSGVLIVILLLLNLLLFFNNVSNNVKIKRLEKRYRLFMRGADGQSLEKEFARKFNQLDKLQEGQELHDKNIKELKVNFSKIYSKYGIEKYDAFDDMGGKLSFALCMLDQNNSGIMLNAVHSRDNCFLYMKEIVKGESYVMLSQEEVEALRKAVNMELYGAP